MSVESSGGAKMGGWPKKVLEKAVENEIRVDPESDPFMIATKLGVDESDVLSVLDDARQNIEDGEDEVGSEEPGKPWWNINREWTLHGGGEDAYGDCSGVVVLEGRDDEDDVEVDLEDLPGEEVLLDLGGQVVNVKVRSDVSDS